MPLFSLPQLWVGAGTDPGSLAVDAIKVKALVESHLQGCEAVVDGEGNKYDITVIGEVFAGLRPVKKQQLVYGALGDQIADGSIHAVSIATFTPEQWQAR